MIDTACKCPGENQASVGQVVFPKNIDLQRNILQFDAENSPKSTKYWVGI